LEIDEPEWSAELEESGFLSYFRAARALSHPQDALPEFTGSAVSDDSQFFATATCIYPNLPEILPRRS
jgi:hypothetical protein